MTSQTATCRNRLEQLVHLVEAAFYGDSAARHAAQSQTKSLLSAVAALSTPNHANAVLDALESAMTPPRHGASHPEAHIASQVMRARSLLEQALVPFDRHSELAAAEAAHREAGDAETALRRQMEVAIDGDDEVAILALRDQLLVAPNQTAQTELAVLDLRLVRAEAEVAAAAGVVDRAQGSAAEAAADLEAARAGLEAAQRRLGCANTAVSMGARREHETAAARLSALQLRRAEVAARSSADRRDRLRLLAGLDLTPPETSA